MNDKQVKTILRLDSSARQHQSITRHLGDEVVRRLSRLYPGARVTVRNLYKQAGFLNERWVQANMTDPGERDQALDAVLMESDRLVRELESADVVVVTAPVYNFSVPAALKAWIDMICRARVTFRYTDEGPAGLLADRPVYLVMASGGVPFGSQADFASGYLRHILGFIGLHDVRMVLAEGTNTRAHESEAAALAMLDQWLPVESIPAVA